jgi:hypothetical protein
VRTISFPARSAAAICLKGTWPRTPSDMPVGLFQPIPEQISQRTEACYPGSELCAYRDRTHTCWPEPACRTSMNKTRQW